MYRNLYVNPHTGRYWFGYWHKNTKGLSGVGKKNVVRTDYNPEGPWTNEMFGVELAELPN